MSLIEALKRCNDASSSSSNEPQTKVACTPAPNSRDTHPAAASTGNTTSKWKAWINIIKARPQDLDDDIMDVVDLLMEEVSTDVTLLHPSNYAAATVLAATIATASPRAALSHYQLHLRVTDAMTPQQYLLCAEGVYACVRASPSLARPFKASTYGDVLHSLASGLDAMHAHTRKQALAASTDTPLSKQVPALCAAVASTLAFCTSFLPSDGSIRLVEVQADLCRLLASTARLLLLLMVLTHSSSGALSASQPQSEPANSFTVAILSASVAHCIIDTARLDCGGLLHMFWAASNGHLHGQPLPPPAPSVAADAAAVADSFVAERLARLAFPPPKQPKAPRPPKGRESSVSASGNNAVGTGAGGASEPVLPAPLRSVMAGAERRIKAHAAAAATAAAAAAEADANAAAEEMKQTIARPAKSGAAGAAAAGPAPARTSSAAAAASMAADSDSGSESDSDDSDDGGSGRSVALQATSDRHSLASMLLFALLYHVPPASASAGVGGGATDCGYTGFLAVYQRRIQPQSASQPIASLLPSGALQPAVLLKQYIPVLDVAMRTEASFAVRSSQRQSSMDLGHDVPGSDSGVDDAEVDDSDGQLAASSPAVTALSNLLAPCPPSAIDAPHVDRWSSERGTHLDEDGDGAEGADCDDDDDGCGSVPAELRLCRSLVTLAAHTSHAEARTRTYIALQSLLTVYAPPARFGLLYALVESCPYPNLHGLLIDRARSEVAAANRQAMAMRRTMGGQAAASQAAPSSSPPSVSISPFLTPRLGELVMSIAHARLEQGLLEPEASRQARVSRQAARDAATDPVYGVSSAVVMDSATALTVAQHLESCSDVDLALLSLLRLVLMMQKNWRAASIERPEIIGQQLQTGQPPQSPTDANDQHQQPHSLLLHPSQLALLRDSYCTPLIRCVLRAQAVLRAEGGLAGLHAHPAPFPNPPVTQPVVKERTPAELADRSAVAATCAVPGEVASPSAVLAMTGGPPMTTPSSAAPSSLRPSISTAASSSSPALSRLLLLDAALKPVMELLDDSGATA